MECREIATRIQTTSCAWNVENSKKTDIQMYSIAKCIEYCKSLFNEIISNFIENEDILKNKIRYLELWEGKVKHLLELIKNSQTADQEVIYPEMLKYIETKLVKSW